MFLKYLDRNIQIETVRNGLNDYNLFTDKYRRVDIVITIIILRPNTANTAAAPSSKAAPSPAASKASLGQKNSWL